MIVYSRHYNIHAFGLERLHPFDTCKYGRAWGLLRSKLGPRATELRVTPQSFASWAMLRNTHTLDYLHTLSKSYAVAQILEVRPAQRVPAPILNRLVLRPMRWGVQGTVVGLEEALRTGWAVNLSGGYHHASCDRGEGFCVFSDVGIAVKHARQQGVLSRDDRIAYIDLDAHQGNGVSRVFKDDPTVCIFDMFNEAIYPFDDEARARVDVPIPLRPGVGDFKYLDSLASELPRFLDAIKGSARVAIYNAGTDIFTDDALGGMRVSEEGILRRDRFVIKQLRKREIPFLIVPSGGYSKVSYRMLASAAEIAAEGAV